MGQYSTGKTTFIKYLLESEFLGMRIGPEPTTDCFIIISQVSPSFLMSHNLWAFQGDKDEVTGKISEGVVPGNALVVDRTKPFRALSAFGNAFLSRYLKSKGFFILFFFILLFLFILLSDYSEVKWKIRCWNRFPSLILREFWVAKNKELTVVIIFPR